MGGAARPRGRDASAACRSGTTTRRATDTPHSLTGIHSATGQRWCSFSLNGPDSCSRWGRGTRATPRRARPPPAVTLQLPRPAEQGTHLKTHRRDPPVLAHLGSERETPAHRPAHPLPPPGLGVPHSPGGEKASRPPPPPRGTQEIRLYVPGEPHPAPAHRRAKRGLAPVYLAGPSGRPLLEPGQPGPALSPRRRRVGEGWVPPQRGARRLRRGAGGGEGREEGAASPAPLQCLQPPSHYLGRKWGKARGKGLWGHMGDDGNGSRPGGASATPGSRRPGRSPGISHVGALSTPGNGNRERALIPAEVSLRKQVARGCRELPSRVQRKRSRRPSPPEETPPQPSHYRRASGLKG